MSRLDCPQGLTEARRCEPCGAGLSSAGPAGGSRGTELSAHPGRSVRSGRGARPPPGPPRPGAGADAGADADAGAGAAGRAGLPARGRSWLSEERPEMRHSRREPRSVWC